LLQRLDAGRFAVRVIGTLYWSVVGLLTIVGVYLSVLYNSPPYFFLAVLVLAVLGVWWPGPRYSWAALIAFGGLPALLLSLNLLVQIAQADWSCSKVSFQPGRSYGYGDPATGEFAYCATIPGQLIVTVAVFLGITLFGAVALLFVLRRADGPAGSRGTLSGVIGIGVILLVVIGGIAFRAKDAAAPPMPEERAGLPPNGLPVSCPKGTAEIGMFNGVGDRTTPEFGMNGEGWRYAYASTGSGAFTIEVLDEDGNTVPSSTVSGTAGGEGHSSRLEAPGTFSFKIEADELVGNTVLACDEIVDPNSENRRDLGS
jgi:hypothetical protein